MYQCIMRDKSKLFKTIVSTLSHPSSQSISAVLLFKRIEYNFAFISS